MQDNMQGSAGGARRSSCAGRGCPPACKQHESRTQVTDTRCREGRSTGQAQRAPGLPRRADSVCWRRSEGLLSSRNRNLSWAGLQRLGEKDGRGWLLGECRGGVSRGSAARQGGRVQTPRGLVRPARVGVKEAQRGHGEVKEDEARGGIPELLWLQASSFGLTMKRGPERRGKPGSSSWGSGGGFSSSAPATVAQQRDRLPPSRRNWRNG